ncbi:MAG: hypothetical protein ACYTF1_22475, partial [Planctomycetota bacterium]
DICDSVDFEHQISNHQTTTFVDIFVRKGKIEVAIEIETTARHAVDNAKKAAMVGVPLYVIVPTHCLKSHLTRKFDDLELHPCGKPIKILLIGELRQELTNFLSRRINSRINNKKNRKPANNAIEWR